MRLSRRGQVIACVAIVAGVVLLAAMRFFLASQSSEPEVAATAEPSLVGASFPQQTERESTTQFVAPSAAQGTKPASPRRGQTLTGRVYDQATSTGIAAATLSWRDAQAGRYDGSWRSRSQFTTLADGTFKLDGVPPGRVVLDVSKAGYADREVYVAVALGANPSLEIALSAGAAISGRLTAADRVTPVAGNVRLVNIEETSGVTIRAGAAGEFSFAGIAPGSYRLTGHGTSGFGEMELTLTDGQRMDDLVLALQSGGIVRGTIAGVRAEELARTTVSVRRQDRLEGLITTRPDERGTYILVGVPSGAMSVTAQTKRRSRVHQIEMRAASDLTVDFHFSSGSRLSGRVARRGKPLSGAQVYPIRPMESGTYIRAVQTSATGEYAIEDLPDGEYRFSVAGYLAPPVRVAGDTVFDFEVPSLNVSGTVVDAPRREPVAWASVFVAPASPELSVRSRRVETDAYGRFAFDTSAPGDYVVTIYKPGYELIRKRITVGTADADASAALTEDEGIGIRLQSADGTPIRMVFLSESNGDLLLRGFALRLDERGEGQLPRAFVGSKLQFYRDDFASLVIPRWDGDALDLTLAPAGAR